MVYNASKAKVENYKELGLHSETAVMFNLTSREQVIANTWYGGEMKKGMFSMMNYFLPLKGIASMHCSANTDMDGKNTAIFFGLSGTGKTTLSTDPKRLLIGDDEHGWDDNGVFNFEGGCYAKVINLDKESEPDIYNAIKRNALLENVTLDENGKIDFADKSVTENTRVSYPITHIEKIVRPISAAPDAKNVIFLSADAFGVLPPVSVLTPEQTKYYFLSGFTAKLAGTERGITEPTPTFSACFGQAFLELHPTKYAEELVKKMEKSGAKAYLVNTGWNGTGKRISIKDTRGIIDAILNGSILKAPTKKIPYFDFEVPTELPGVDSHILDPRDTYADASQWDAKAKDLAGRFIKNFAKYEGNEAGKALVAAGPQSVIHWFSQGCAFGRAPFPLSIFFGGETPCPSSFAGPGRETICSFGSFSRKLPRCTTKAVLTFFRKKAGFIPRRNLPGCWLTRRNLSGSPRRTAASWGTPLRWFSVPGTTRHSGISTVFTLTMCACPLPVSGRESAVC